MSTKILQPWPTLPVDRARSSWLRRAARVDYCLGIALAGVDRSTGRTWSAEGLPCGEQSCERCGPPLVERILVHLARNWSADDRLWIHFYRSDQKLRESFFQIARRKSKKIGEPIRVFTAQSVDGWCITVASSELTTRAQQHGSWIASRHAYAIVRESILSLDKVRAWPMGTGDWKILKNDDRTRSSGRNRTWNLRNGEFERACDAAMDLFEVQTGVRFVASIGVDKALLNLWIQLLDQEIQKVIRSRT